MQPGDPTRLSLQLNFSIFCYESLKEQEQALEMAFLIARHLRQLNDRSNGRKAS